MGRTRAFSTLAKNDVPIARNPASARQVKIEVPMARNPASFTNNGGLAGATTVPESRHGCRRNPASSRLEDNISPPVITPKEEPLENISPPVKASASGVARGTSKSSKGKRKSYGEESKTTNRMPLKKVKTGNNNGGLAGATAATESRPGLGKNSASSRVHVEVALAEGKEKGPVIVEEAKRQEARETSFKSSKGKRNSETTNGVPLKNVRTENNNRALAGATTASKGRPGRRRSPASSRLEDDTSPPVIAPKEEPVENISPPVKASASEAARETKRRIKSKTTNGVPLNKGKTENNNRALAGATTASESRPGSSRNNGALAGATTATESRPVRKKRHTDWAGADLFKSGLAVQPLHPYFVTVAKQCRENELYVPKEMLRMYQLDLPQNIELIDERGMNFCLYLKEWADGRKFYANGWKYFCLLNGVTVDDKVICEFTQGRSGKLYLHGRVVRANGDNIW